jgi:dUTP pyrophosphatase
MLRLADDAGALLLTPITEKQKQPNAVDLRLAKLFAFNDVDISFICADNNVGGRTTHLQQIDLEPEDEESIDGRNVKWFELQSGNAYQFLCTETVAVPDKMAGWLVARSSLNRNGVFIMSGLYDSGFRGQIGGTMYCFRPCRIEVGARVAQFLLTDAEMRERYDGQWQDQTSASLTGKQGK